MSEINVRIVNLEPYRVASAYGFGSGPEGIAWKKMIAYVKSKGLERDGQAHRYLGFNNPSPTPGSPNYGYEQWITIGPETEVEGDIQIKEFSGGLYAVTRCQLRSIGETWQALAGWREKSQYQSGRHQWLEEVLVPPSDETTIDEDMELDLYLPIAR
ncbi:MAG: GyrI-like domain-containing protein [Anaerolineaceae bacterium]|nr:GyrI-like domain-containing protein [Anaerolineaceae bacterium]